MKKLSRKAAESAQATLEGWERTLELVDELSRDEWLALLPEVQKELARSIEELLAGRSSSRETRRRLDVLGKLLRRIEYRIKRG
jgi:hypothetical protein